MNIFGPKFIISQAFSSYHFSSVKKTKQTSIFGIVFNMGENTRLGPNIITSGSPKKSAAKNRAAVEGRHGAFCGSQSWDSKVWGREGKEGRGLVFWAYQDGRWMDVDRLFFVQW